MKMNVTNPTWWTQITCLLQSVAKVLSYSIEKHYITVLSSSGENPKMIHKSYKFYNSLITYLSSVIQRDSKTSCYPLSVEAKPICFRRILNLQQIIKKGEPHPNKLLPICSFQHYIALSFVIISHNN